MTRKKLVPLPQDGCKFSTEAHQIFELLVNLLHLFARQRAYHFAGHTTCVTGFQYPCQFTNAEAQPYGAADELHACQSFTDTTGSRFVCVAEQVASSYVRNNATYPGLCRQDVLAPRSEVY